MNENRAALKNRVCSVYLYKNAKKYCNIRKIHVYYKLNVGCVYTCILTDLFIRIWGIGGYADVTE